jgi:hypothetical protein
MCAPAVCRASLREGGRERELLAPARALSQDKIECVVKAYVNVKWMASCVNLRTRLELSTKGNV